jgi:hypothetical protein
MVACVFDRLDPMRETVLMIISMPLPTSYLPLLRQISENQTNSGYIEAFIIEDSLRYSGDCDIAIST